MRLHQLLPLLPLATAFVITESPIFDTLEEVGRREKLPSLRKPIANKFDRIVKSGKNSLASTQNALDDALKETLETVKDVSEEVYHRIHETGCHIESWLEGSSFDNSELSFEEDPRHPPHHGPPHKDPHHGPPHHKDPHHGHPKPNLTVYELISKSKYTTKLAKLIDKYSDLVDTLNSTKANFTVFAPTDAAFEKIPKHGHKPSKEFLKDLLLYHVSEGLYPAGRVLHSYTIPTLYKPSHLGHAQRLTVRLTLKGPTINFYSRVVAVNVFGTNGVIHGLDSILVPPPKVATIIDLLPGEFSTLELGLGKTGLYDKMNNSDDYPHTGGTFFAPSNFAFKKLGPRINAFLFSQHGLKYLKALLKYNIVVDQTLYSDAFFDAKGKDGESEAAHPPYSHYDLQTALEGKPLAVDVARYGPFIEIKINAFLRVTVHDGVASDGVIQVVSNVLIPPKRPGGEAMYWTGEEMSVDELKERLEPLVGEEEDNLEL